MATLKDIAAELGLNVSVVSRALNPKPDKHAVVAEETKKLIIETAERLGYRRNRIAEFMKRGRAATIGAFIPGVPNRLIADLMIGISEQAMEQGFPVNFSYGAKLTDFQRFFAGITDVSHSGIITYPYKDQVADQLSELLNNYKDSGGNIIVLNAYQDYGDIPVLDIDDRAGGELAAKVLVECGCKTFLIDKEYIRRSDACRAYLATCKKTVEYFTKATFPKVLQQYVDTEKAGPLGVFCTSDQCAVELYPVIQNAGLTIGKDVCLIGYDDLFLTEFITPSLSTIHQPFKEQGKRAVTKLINMIYGEPEKSELIRPRFVERNSTKK